MTTKLRKARAKKAVRHALRKVSPEDVATILGKETKIAEVKAEVQAEKVPGQIMADTGTKVSWTKSDLEARFPIVELFSEENVKITWNGVVYQLLSGATHYVPSVIKDAYLQHRREARMAGKSMPTDSGFTTTVELGAGSLEPA